MDSQRRLVANKPVEVALNEIVTRARVFTDAGGAAIALRDGDELVTRASSGGIAPDVGARNKIEGSLTGQAVLKGVPIHIEDSDKDPRVDAEVCRSINTRSFIITPIAGSTTMLGVLAVFAPNANAFTRTDLAVLRTMADQIATALGGGAFMQQLWPSGKSDVETAPAPAAWQPEEQTQEPEAAFEAPVPEPPRAVEPPRAKAAPADVRVQKQRPAPTPEPPVEEPELLDVPELAMEIEVAPAAPVRHVEARTTKAPAIPQVEPRAVQEEIEPIAQKVEAPKVIAKPAAAPKQPVAPPRQQAIPKRHEEVAPQQQQQVSGRMKPQKHVETEAAVEEVVEKRRPVQDRAEKATAVRAEREVAPRTEAVEWKGLSVEPEQRSTGKIIMVAAGVLLIAGAIVGGVMFRNSSKKAAVPTTPATQTAAATAPVTPVPASTEAASGQKNNKDASASTKPTQTSSTQNNSSSQPAAAPSKPAQPAIVIGRGNGGNNQQIDEAPPQLALAAAQPGIQLNTSSGAMPVRPTSDAAPAQVIRKVNPVYPDMARRIHQKGIVILQAQILKDGTVGKIEVSSGPTLLRNAAVDCVKQWRYRPAYLGGAPTESTVRVEVGFNSEQ